jgi:pilus assembly protein Flp/PilA
MAAVVHEIARLRAHDSRSSDDKNANEQAEQEMQALTWIRDDEDGATAIEYGLIAALVSVVGILALTRVGEFLTQLFLAVANALSSN